MLKLLESIKVIDYNSDSSCSKSRLWINSGTIQSIKSKSFATLYSNNAFIPFESWREAKKDEKKLLYVDSIDVASYPNPSTHIGIIAIPQEALVPLEELGVSFVQSIEDCQMLVSEAAYQQAVDNILQYLQPLCISDRKFIVHNIATNSTGLNTVTYNPEEQCFIGLHLDSWDRFPLEKRHLSTNRICINLGFEDRFFLFINLTLMDIFYLLNVNELDEAPEFSLKNRQERLRQYYFSNPSNQLKTQPDYLRQMFLHQYPHYPVVKVRVSPGEAYIAPTENIIQGHLRLPQLDMKF
jgi:hypothetical protein